MQLSKRDYKRIVELVRNLEKSRTKRLMWGIALAAMMTESNPRFDKDKFIDAIDRRADDEPSNSV